MPRYWRSAVAAALVLTATVAWLAGAQEESLAFACDAPGYIQFAINTHDIINLVESADTVLRLIDLFERHSVRGDFYLTGAMVNLYEEHRPDVIARLRDSEMTISYHVRPPHPLNSGFDDPLQGLRPKEIMELLEGYETYKLDIATGGLLRDEFGGYTHSEDVFGRPPSTIAFSSLARYKELAFPMFARLGAEVGLVYHETGADISNPLPVEDGLISRPSDLSVTRWASGNSDKVNFWWNMLATPEADAYDPAGYLGGGIAAWDHDRPPFVTALIHENNFYRQGATPWSLVYFESTDKEVRKFPPYDLNSEDPSKPRVGAEAVWEAYEALVAYAAEHLIVITSADLASLAATYCDCGD